VSQEQHPDLAQYLKLKQGNTIQVCVRRSTPRPQRRRQQLLRIEPDQPAGSAGA
jgi:hypothetical protein